MKNLYTLLIAFICIMGYSQDTLTYLDRSYFFEIDSVEINSFKYIWENEQKKEELRNNYLENPIPDNAQFRIIQEVDIPLLEKSTKVEDGENIIYYLHVKNDVEEFDFEATLNIPEGAALQVFYLAEDYCKSFKKEDYKYEKYHFFGYDDLIIKVTVPKQVKQKPEINIKRFRYFLFESLKRVHVQ